MSHPDCPRQIVFTLPGAPGVQITATEVGGNIEFVVDVLDTAGSTGDLRALFFHLNEDELAGLTITSSEPLLKEWRTGDDSILDLGDGANLSGKVKSGFDVGLEWGTPGGKKDDITFPVEFTLSNSTGDLTLDDLGGMLFGAKLDSVGGPGGPRGSTAKLTTIAPFAPDAIDDVVNMFEDGASGLNDPSKSPTAVQIFVLANDTDGDTPQSQFIIDDIPEGPLHGTVTIAPDGKSIYYTPDLDYSGTDSFWYCMSDGNGGQDSALVTINIAAVADDPVITISVASISETEHQITVTATQDDADGSEDIASLDWTAVGGLAGATLTPLGPVVGSGNQLQQLFTLTTLEGQDYNLDLDFTAVSQESSNADTESHTESQPIDIDYTLNQDTLTYEVVDQSIWDTGDAFEEHIDEFLGIDNFTFGGSGGDPDILGTSYDVGGSLTAGFQLTANFFGGAIDATIPADVTVETTYHETTDVLFIDSLLALGSGLTFTTTGPEGDILFQFIFDAEAHAFAELVHVTLINESFHESWTETIFDFDSTDPPPDPWNLLGGIVSVGIAWPHLSVSNDPGLASGSGESNSFLYATLDIDALANYFLGGALSFLDANPTDPDNFELLDLDLTGGLNFIQEFAIGLAETSVSLVLEDGFVVPMTFGQQIRIDNASSHDANGDGTISFSFDLDPNVTLSNDTDLGAILTAHLWILKNFDLGALVDEEVLNISGSIADIYSNSFALEGVGAQSYAFLV
ncbi:MAG TPA: Ig-like domain-containing protein [Sphingomicrobium sp.]|nr:Ig-like domain-containing protein [Sphingomicrobium sp.]